MSRGKLGAGTCVITRGLLSRWRGVMARMDDTRAVRQYETFYART